MWVNNWRFWSEIDTFGEENKSYDSRKTSRKFASSSFFSPTEILLPDSLTWKDDGTKYGQSVIKTSPTRVLQRKKKTVFKIIRSGSKARLASTNKKRKYIKNDSISHPRQVGMRNVFLAAWAVPNSPFPPPISTTWHMMASPSSSDSVPRAL